jgi:O-antigen ligase
VSAPATPAPRQWAGIGLFLLWLVATVGVLVLRPGEVLEMGIVGAVGYVGFGALQRRRVELPIALTAAACFAAPLLYAWPVRSFEEHQVPGSSGALTSVGSLLPLAALIAVAGWKRASFTGAPPLLIAGVAALAVAGVTSSIAATQSASTFANTWLVYGTPICLGLAIFASSRKIEDVHLYLEMIVLGTLPQLIVAIAAYVVDFGVPTSARDLVTAKAALFRPHLIQDQALGNVGHLSDLGLALLLPATIIASGRRVHPAVRAVAAATTLAVIAVLVLILSRSAMAAAVLILSGAFVVMLRRPRYPIGMTVIAAASLVLIAVSVAPSVRRSYESLVPTTQSTSGTHSSPGPDSAGGDSTEFRLAAQKTAWGVAKAHMPWGVGTGQYALYDPVHTAPHSLPLQTLSEMGVLGAVGWLLVAAYAVWRSALMVLRRQRTWWPAELAAAGSVLAVLLHGTIAGLTLRLGHDNTASLLLWIGLGCLAAVERIGRKT